MLRKREEAKCTFHNFRSLSQLGDRSLEAQGGLGGYDRQLVVPREQEQVKIVMECDKKE